MNCGCETKKYENLKKYLEENKKDNIIKRYDVEPFRKQFISNYNPNENKNISRVLISGGDQKGESLKWNIQKIKKNIGHIPWTINGGIKNLLQDEEFSEEIIEKLEIKWVNQNSNLVKFIELALSKFSDFMGIDFHFLGDASNNTVIYNKSIMDFSFFNLFNIFGNNTLGVGSFPSFNDILPSFPSGNSWYTTNLINYDSLEYSNYIFWLILHEIGHTVGLRHPFDSDITLKGISIEKNNIGDLGPLYQNSIIFSVMSYNTNDFVINNKYINIINNLQGFTTSLGSYDIAALNFLYGKKKIMNQEYTLFNKNENLYPFTTTSFGFLNPNWETIYGKDVILNLPLIEPIDNFQKQTPVILDLRLANLKYNSKFAGGYISCYKPENDQSFQHYLDLSNNNMYVTRFFKLPSTDIETRKAGGYLISKGTTFKKINIETENNLIILNDLYRPYEICTIKSKNNTFLIKKKSYIKIIKKKNIIIIKGTNNKILFNNTTKCIKNIKCLMFKYIIDKNNTFIFQ